WDRQIGGRQLPIEVAGDLSLDSNAAIGLAHALERPFEAGHEPLEGGRGAREAFGGLLELEIPRRLRVGLRHDLEGRLRLAQTILEQRGDLEAQASAGAGLSFGLE